ncbi:hypothetical protein PTKU46_88340 [Paraburkholderia terrae]|jgi:hypothetical protein|uniref:Uncharacterized protein n=1 Tax=Paraburkholderia terrae TaxID=311230 RepID=A0ABN6JXN5_9BURK|nr:hypothetical protein PTKU64_83980 [Paraburkholderia terrae]BDC45421.1 hypothetical protein PTKU15_87180 [Paraburkholderia terrae]
MPRALSKADGHDGATAAVSLPGTGLNPPAHLANAITTLMACHFAQYTEKFRDLRRPERILCPWWF